MKSIKISFMVVFWFVSSPFVQAQDAERILETNRPALVSIWTFIDAAFNDINGLYSFDTLVFWGSGFIISEEGHVGTCYHVISQLDTILVKTSTGLFIPSWVISVDTVNDLALLKIQVSENRKFPFVELGNSDDLKTGEPIYAIGNPLGYEYSISQGIISGIRDSAKEYIEGEERIFERVIQTDAAISPGNSGGAFFNTKGQVIGITSYHYLSLGNLNFGVAINCFKALMERANREDVVPVFKTKDAVEEKIEYYLSIANDLKQKIRQYNIMNDSLGKNLKAKPSSLPGDTILSTVNSDSLDDVYRMKAEYLYYKCLNLDSTYFNTYDDLVDYFIKISKPEKAEEFYRKAQELFPGDPGLEYLANSLESYYLRYKDFNKIRELYGVVQGKNEVRADVYYKLGFVYEKVGDTNAAVEQYRIAVKKDPGFYKALFQIGKYYYKNGFYLKAKKYFESAYEKRFISDQPHRDSRSALRDDTYSDFELHYYLAMISIREGDRWGALINYLRLNPSDMDESVRSFKLYKKIVK